MVETIEIITFAEKLKVIDDPETLYENYGALVGDSFSDKAAPCFTQSCINEDTVRVLKKSSDDKKSVCALAFDIESGELLGNAQLQFEGMEGNLSLDASVRHKCKPKECYLEQISVSGSARGKGVGSKLLKWCDDMALNRGCTEITLEVLSTNTGAKSLYERKGYQVDPSTIPDGPIDGCITRFVHCMLICRFDYAVFMRKPLVNT
mmetsp:Transcript_20762/g.25184  ORF Transcript_20762/g.25184 Transcript_20762/m.25184 type:complete len:206 (+) Transcript_20762:289-906(+)